MGKTSRWLRSLLGSKKPPESSSPDSSSSLTKDNKKKSTSSSNSNSNFNSKWGVIKSSIYDNKTSNSGGGAGPPRWSYDGSSASSPYAAEQLDPNKHAIAVAAATAAVAEAALAAAQAAAEVVRLTSAAGTSAGGTRTVSSFTPSGTDWRQELAATKIQSAFRAYLARRALRALKGLVKLQALVRGRIVRKQSADMLRRMQAMARIQARAFATRTNTSASSNPPIKSSYYSHAGTPGPKRHDHPQHVYGIKHGSPEVKRWGSKPNISNSIKVKALHSGSSWLDRWMEECAWNNQRGSDFNNVSCDDEKSIKILEIDTWKPHHNPRQSDKAFQASHAFRAWNENGQSFTAFDPISGLAAKLEKPNPSVSSGEVLNLRSLKFLPQEEQGHAWTADSSPCIHSASSRPGSNSRRGPFTPTRSECSRSVYGDYLSHPSYMANTESSLAKVRSQSAPRQRTRYEGVETNRKFVSSLWDAETISENGYP